MIEAKDLTKKYGSKTAVDHVTFTVQPGIVTGFLGPNGAGKSTTMRMILGLDHPSSGSVTVSGKPYGKLATPLKEIGALLADPKIVMFDEPVNGLDPDGVVWVRQLARELSESGRTVFLSSHLMSEVQQTADHVIVIGRSSVGTIFTIVALELILPPFLPAMASSIANWIGAFLPQVAAKAALATATVDDGSISLSPAGGLTVLILWGVIPMVAAWIVLRVRDV
ncbi:ABC transporter ATP-binding protein [Demequina sediminicola]|uniref:ABC transporter ATP-binding protein n=1 Tax=Demequina sediminicola TaxID=1095026 RepID=UPI0007856B59|nr:ATP-binding cassette domain-containing protein [Demequina sediminicola]